MEIEPLFYKYFTGCFNGFLSFILSDIAGKRTGSLSTGRSTTTGSPSSRAGEPLSSLPPGMRTLVSSINRQGRGQDATAANTGNSPPPVLFNEQEFVLNIRTGNSPSSLQKTRICPTIPGNSPSSLQKTRICPTNPGNSPLFSSKNKNLSYKYMEFPTPRFL